MVNASKSAAAINFIYVVTFGHCRKKDCHFPHDLNGKNNRHIIEQLNCQNIDPFLLVPLIQLYNRFSHHSFQVILSNIYII